MMILGRKRWARHVIGMGQKKTRTKFQSKNLKERDYSGDIVISGRILKWNFQIGYEEANGIHLAQDRDQWRALLKTVINLWVP
jgi:hypothetical protein